MFKKVLGGKISLRPNLLEVAATQFGKFEMVDPKDYTRASGEKFNQDGFIVYNFLKRAHPHNIMINT